MKKYTKEERQKYYKKLRDEWNGNKQLAENDTDAKAQYQAIAENSPTGQISYYSFYFIYSAMKKLGLDGLPYVDAKTYNGWKKAGFKVKKGEKAKLRGITWVVFKEKDDDEEEETTYMYPKEYKLFHKSQVEEIV